MVLLPSGKLLLANNRGDSLSMDRVRRSSLLLLNADGTPDPGFNAGVAFYGGGEHVGQCLVQPDGKLVISGRFYAFNQQPAGNMVRLNPNGSVDAAFMAAGSGFNNNVFGLALQPDGKLVVGGSFTQVHGQSAPPLVRLLPGGAQDPSFAPPAAALGQSVTGLVRQPDGKLVVTTTGNSGPRIVRLLPSGGLDPSFQQDPRVGVQFQSFTYGPTQATVSLQPNGAIVVAGFLSLPGTGQTYLARLTPTGALDATFAVPSNIATTAGTVYDVQPLVNGQLLVASTPVRYGGASAPLASVALLNADGTRDPAFGPRVQGPGTVTALVRQPDGKLVLGGIFDEINGVAASNLARLNPNGTVDGSFAVAGAGPDGDVYSVAVQPDGKVLAAGTFARVGAVPRPGLARWLPSGSLDAAFVPAIAPLAQPPYYSSVGGKVVVQPDGKVMVTGWLGNATGAADRLLRLDGATGQVDASFRLAPPTSGIGDVLPWPNGGYVVTGSLRINNQDYRLARLLPDGTLDPAFALTAQLGGNTPRLAPGPNGTLYVSGDFTAYGSFASRSVVRLLPNGVPDPGFVNTMPTLTTVSASAIAVQPNGRLLLAGSFFSTAGGAGGVVRLFANGGLDPSFDMTDTPKYDVFDLLVQPDGAIVAAGNFTEAFGLPYYGLVRMTATNVLNVAAPQERAFLEAWPVPAHDMLNIRLDAAARPQQVLLHDAVGRVVLRHTVPQSQMVLNTASLVPGTYILSVRYATGTVVRRIAVE